jgi:hypothetical protein
LAGASTSCWPPWRPRHRRRAVAGPRSITQLTVGGGAVVARLGRGDGGTTAVPARGVVREQRRGLWYGIAPARPTAQLGMLLALYRRRTVLRVTAFAVS